MKTIANENLRIWPAKAFKLQTAFPCLIAVVVFAAVSAARAGLITNPPPEAVNNVLQRAPDAPVRVRIATLLANDRDAGHGPLSLVSVSATSAAGGLVARRGQWICYMPPAGFTNSDSFSYVITNRSGLTATGSVSIIIQAKLNRSPDAADTAGSNTPSTAP
jgi:hypothetical protein